LQGFQNLAIALLWNRFHNDLRALADRCDQLVEIEEDIAKREAKGLAATSLDIELLNEDKEFKAFVLQEINQSIKDGTDCLIQLQKAGAIPSF
jgi:hypothetical protein